MFSIFLHIENIKGFGILALKNGLPKFENQNKKKQKITEVKKYYSLKTCYGTLLTPVFSINVYFAGPR